MFKVSQTESYSWPVTFKTAGDGGKFESHTFDAKFKRVPQTRIKEIVAAAAADETDDHKIVREIMIGWSGIMEGDTELPFSNGALHTILDVPGVSGAIVTAWMESLSGAKRKN